MKRIWIDAGKCDGCLNCTLACMNAHRADKGSIYDLDLTDPANESCKDSGSEPSCVKACPKKAIWIEEVES